MVVGIQVIGLIFGFFMLYMTFVYLKQKSFNKKDFLLWSAVWILFLFTVIFPQSMDFVLEALDIHSAMTLLSVFAIIILVSVVFYQHKLVRINRRKIESIVKTLALKETKDE